MPNTNLDEQSYCLRPIAVSRPGSEHDYWRYSSRCMLVLTAIELRLSHVCANQKARELSGVWNDHLPGPASRMTRVWACFTETELCK
jgi:hypothetical protein